MVNDVKDQGGLSVASKDWLEHAKARMDPCFQKGDICRGAYISDRDGIMYLTKSGTLTRGVQGPDNWWDDMLHATVYLAELNRSNV